MPHNEFLYSQVAPGTVQWLSCSDKDFDFTLICTHFPKNGMKKNKIELIIPQNKLYLFIKIVDSLQINILLTFEVTWTKNFKKTEKHRYFKNKIGNVSFLFITFAGSGGLVKSYFCLIQ